MLRRFLSWTLAATLSAGLLSCGFGGNSRTSQETEGVPQSVLQNLEGNYAMRQTSSDGTHYSTAVVKEIAEGQYQIARITVYGPVLYGFTVGEQASVSSAELGEGSISYKASIKKTTIRFQKEDFICELSK
ncbi:MAG: hypothetical protein IJ651_07265 [Bacteroidales bacterium]|nr:hypothetical protein [Bacteroidales bacterium]